MDWQVQDKQLAVSAAVKKLGTGSSRSLELSFWRSQGASWFRTGLCWLGDVGNINRRCVISSRIGRGSFNSKPGRGKLPQRCLEHLVRDRRMISIVTVIKRSFLLVVAVTCIVRVAAQTPQMGAPVTDRLSSLEAEVLELRQAVASQSSLSGVVDERSSPIELAAFCESCQPEKIFAPTAKFPTARVTGFFQLDSAWFNQGNRMFKPLEKQPKGL